MRRLTVTTALACLALPFLAAAGAQAAKEEVDRAVQLRIDAIASDPDEPRNYFNLGLEYYNRDDYENASKAFQKALKVGRKNAEAHAAVDMDCYQILGDIYMRQEKYKLAAGWFAQGLKHNSRDPVCLFGRGQAYFFSRDYKNAKKAFEAYLAAAATSGDPKASKESPTALTYLGAMAMEQKKYDEAADRFRKVIAQYPKQSKEASVNLAIVLLTKGDQLVSRKKIDDAVQLYDEAVAVDSSNAGALKASARWHYELGMGFMTSKKPGDEAKTAAQSHFKLAERNFLRATRMETGDFQSWYYAGLSQFQLEKYGEMIESYSNSVKINPDQPAARYNLALALFRQQLYDEALKEAGEAKRLAPKDRDTNALINNIYDAYKNDCMTKGNEAISADRFHEAIGWWQKALELDPHAPDAPQYIEQARVRMTELIGEHTGKGDAAYAENDLATASDEWNTALRFDPRNEDLKDKLAKVSKDEQVKAILSGAQKAYAAHDYQAAMAKVKEALAVSPRNASALSLQRKIVSQQSSGVNALVADARRYVRTGKLLRAKRKLEEAREISGDNKTVRALLLEVNNGIEKAIQDQELAAATAVNSGNKAAAQKAYEAILDLDPDNANAAQAIKRLTGKESKATVDAAKVKTLNKQGIFAYMQNNLKAAENAWAEALALDPHNTEIKRSLERVRMKMGKASG